MAMRGEHNNQPKEGCAAKMPATEEKQQERVAQHDRLHNDSNGDNNIGKDDRANNFVVGCIQLI